MIPESSFLLNGDTALWVVEDNGKYWFDINSPCDHCKDGAVGAWPSHLSTCTDCDGTGRHTFDIEVEHRDRLMHWPVTTTYRVHVIDVLPIVADVGPVPEGVHVRITGGGICWLAEPIDGGGWQHTEIALPPDAAPGKWLVRLAVWL